MDSHVWNDIKSRLHARAEEFVRWLFPAAQKFNAHEWCVGSLDGSPGESLKIHVDGAKAGVWRDFSGSDGGNNLLDLLIKARGIPFAEGAQIAADWLGMKLPEKAARTGDKERTRFVTAYDYRNAAGALVHQTVRFHVIDADGRDVIDAKTGSAKKKFLQRRPAKAGMREGKIEAKCDRRSGEWWMWTLTGIEPVLYHLSEIIARSSDDVWIVEGEKDADAMMQHGLLATTCPMGAGKWRDSYTKALAGRRVILCGDSDEAGVKGMETIGRALEPVCELVERVEWEKALGLMGLGDRATEKWDAAKFLKLNYQA